MRNLPHHDELAGRDVYALLVEYQSRQLGRRLRDMPYESFHDLHAVHVLEQ
jgi:hypothetical protein